uniref:CSON005716 protein n=1 Tax=Culicoides sonorensis TaxID=179676 RepID=A0A336MTC9_CULSO
MSTKIQSGNHLMLKLFIIMLEIYHIMCFGDEFGKCVKSNKSPDFKLCLGQQLIQTFNDFESTKGIVLEKDDTVMSRNNLNFLEQDPLDYRSVIILLIIKGKKKKYEDSGRRKRRIPVHQLIVKLKTTYHRKTYL